MGSEKPLAGSNGHEKDAPVFHEVVAEVHVGGLSNGGGCSFAVFTTSRGLHYSSFSAVSEPKRWVKTPTLRDAVETLPTARGTLRILARSKPDSPKSEFDVDFSDRRSFEASGFNLRCTGTSRCVIIPRSRLMEVVG